jgi:4'-phosphopantetheinyl transferase EntD
MTSVGLEAALRTLFPPGVAVAAERIAPVDASALWPEERPSVQGAVPARLQDFVAGRTAARRALAALGQAACALPMAPDRSAIWPDGLSGSIAHAAGYAVAVARQGTPLGVDIEDDADIARDLWSIICGPQELRHLPQDHPGRTVRRLFCAKEAVFKAQPQGNRAMFGHETLHVSLADDHFDAQFLTDAGVFRAGQLVRGRIATVGSVVLAGVAW